VPLSTAPSTKAASRRRDTLGRPQFRSRSGDQLRAVDKRTPHAPISGRLSTTDLQMIEESVRRILQLWSSRSVPFVVRSHQPRVACYIGGEGSRQDGVRRAASWPPPAEAIIAEAQLKRHAVPAFSRSLGSELIINFTLFRVNCSVL